MANLKKLEKRIKLARKRRRKMERKEKIQVLISMIGGAIWFVVLFFMWIIATDEKREEIAETKEKKGDVKDKSNGKKLDASNIASYNAWREEEQ